MRVSLKNTVVSFVAVIGALLATGVVGFTSSAQATAPCVGDTLNSGQTLTAGQSLCSSTYQTVMQGDGNFVVYNSGRPQWFTATSGRGGATLTMQADGNLVMYTASNQAIWSSGTAGHPGSHISMQADGNLVMYSAANKPIWAMAWILAARAVAPSSVINPACKINGVAICADKETSMVYYVVNGYAAWQSHVTFGMSSLPTPNGVYAVYTKSLKSWSTLYNVWMYDALYFLSGYALHYDPLINSHGCIHVYPLANAQWLYGNTPIGTRVVVY